MAMAGAIARPLLTFLYELFVPQKEASLNQIVRRFLHGILFSFIIIVASQQLALFYDAYAQKTEDYNGAVRLYAEEECAFYKGSSQARIKECSELNIIINAWPVTRAISHVIRGWNSCGFSPCQELARNIADHIQYKIGFLLIALALASYIYNFIGCTKKKGKDMYDKYRLKQTFKDMEAFESVLQKKQQQYNTIDFNQPGSVQKV